MQRFRSNCWVRKRGAVWLKICKLLKNDQYQSCQFEKTFGGTELEDGVK